MRRLLTAVAMTAASAFGALAQTADKAPLDQDPTESMQEPLDTLTPPMKATDPEQKGAESTTQTFGHATLSDDQVKEWIGRSVYSSDGKELGEIGDLNRGPDNKVTELYVDIGGFLGLGETRVRAGADKLQEVRDDRIILNITEADAKSLPKVEDEEKAPVQK